MDLADRGMMKSAQTITPAQTPRTTQNRTRICKGFLVGGPITFLFQSLHMLSMFTVSGVVCFSRGFAEDATKTRLTRLLGLWAFLSSDRLDLYNYYVAYAERTARPW